MDMMNKPNTSPLESMAEIWSSTRFPNANIGVYALPRIAMESRQGVLTLSITTFGFLVFASLLSVALELGSTHVYTYSLLAMLALHITVSAYHIQEIRVLYMLAMVLHILCGSALVMLAQQLGRLDMLIIASVAVLLMLVPLVPWGLREAAITISATYAMFTFSLFASAKHFDPRELWIFQLLMIFISVVSLLLVARTLLVRKKDLATQYELHAAHSKMVDLSQRDPLTGSWNRRFIENHFNEILQSYRLKGKRSYFAVFDIDDFKKINDTHGHDRGDVVLKAIEYGFKTQASQGDYLVRIGGDEFILMLQEEAIERRLATLFTLISRFIEEETGKRSLRPTFSLGLIELPKTVSFDEAYRSADALLYQAKRAGGNRIIGADLLNGETSHCLVPQAEGAPA